MKTLVTNEDENLGITVSYLPSLLSTSKQISIDLSPAPPNGSYETLNSNARSRNKRDDVLLRVEAENVGLVSYLLKDKWPVGKEFDVPFQPGSDDGG